ncbi:MAG: flagellar basal body P-ring formation chaperone FlgA [Nitrospirota bacterium]
MVNRVKSLILSIEAVLILIMVTPVMARDRIEITDIMIKRAVEGYIRENLPWDEGEIKIRVMPIRKKLVFPQGKVTFEIDGSVNKSLLGKKNLSVNFKLNGRDYKKVWITVETAVLKDIVVSIRPLNRGHVLQRDDIYLKKADISKLSPDTIFDPSDVMGKRMKRSIKANMPIRDNMIEELPLIKRKDKVIILAESSRIRITTIGEAMNNGYLGEIIPVINLDSKKKVYGRVMNANTVKIEY